MTEVGIWIFDNSVQTSVMILAVLVLSLLFRRLPKGYFYILWIAVFIRLILPTAIISPFGVMPDIPVTQMARQGIVKVQDQLRNILENRQIAADTSVKDNSKLTERSGESGSAGSNQKQSADGVGEMTDNSNSVIANDFTKTNDLSNHQTDENQDNVSMITILISIWLLGAMGMILLSFYRYYRIKQGLSGARPLERFGMEGKAYVSDQIVVPFVLGVWHPKIYVPNLVLKPFEYQCILFHEQMHIKRRDPLIKFLAYLVLCLHWFNPMVWLAYYQLERCMEFSCDEQVIRRLGEREKKVYSQVLLLVASGGTLW